MPQCSSPSKLDPGPLRVQQFKISLRYVDPPVWRRIRVPDCTLDELHKYIQAAMGWTNSHLHEFTIVGRRYGDPELLKDGGGETDLHDSTEIRVSKIVAGAPCGFCFLYHYDFGANWEHDVHYEGASSREPGRLYPCCLEGAGKCPDDDDLAAETFSPAAMTRNMRRCLSGRCGITR